MHLVRAVRYLLGMSYALSGTDAGHDACRTAPTRLAASSSASYAPLHSLSLTHINTHTHTHTRTRTRAHTHTNTCARPLRHTDGERHTHRRTCGRHGGHVREEAHVRADHVRGAGPQGATARRGHQDLVGAGH
eukprot:2620332-Rhodomonas_salina.2